MASDLTWTKPHCGVQHLGKLGDMRWATVSTYESGFAVLTAWSRGTPITQVPEIQLDSTEEAQRAGERWVREGVAAP